MSDIAVTEDDNTIKDDDDDELEKDGKSDMETGKLTRMYCNKLGAGWKTKLKGRREQNK